MNSDNDFLYPIMLKLKDKKCVIIGGGSVAARKLQTLCAAKANVTVVAPNFSEELLTIAAQQDCILLQQEYQKELLANAFITIAATNSFELNRAITEAAPCLCNNITEPALSNFTVPSSFNVDGISVTLATGGMPGYTRLLKRFLQSKLKPSFSQFNTFLLEQRQIVKSIASTSEERTAFWRQALNHEILLLLESDNIEQAKEQIQNAVDSFRTQSQNSSR